VRYSQHLQHLLHPLMLSPPPLLLLLLLPPLMLLPLLGRPQPCTSPLALQWLRERSAAGRRWRAHLPAAGRANA
jgi:hypothetical protein